jgi:hypothetical protein
MKRPSSARRKRPFLLWVSVLWLLSLGAVDFWRSITLWQTRPLLAELGSTLSPSLAALLALGWTICGLSLAAAAVGLWLRHEWGRHTARAAIVAHLVLFQVYTWAFVQTGLLWERRWSALILALVAAAVSLTALTWSKPRRWLGLLQHSDSPTKR